jgi:hypothetical protein
MMRGHNGGGCRVKGGVSYGVMKLPPSEGAAGLA